MTKMLYPWQKLIATSNLCQEIVLAGGMGAGKSIFNQMGNTMGGAVKMGMRDALGGIHAGELYTSSISAFFDNDRFVHQDLIHIRDFFTDYPNVADDRTLAPGGYGLVFGDCIKKKIHTMQGYTTLNQISETSLSLSLTSSRVPSTLSVETDNYIDHNRFARLYKAGYIKNRVVCTYSNTHGPDKHVSPLDISRSVDDLFNEITNTDLITRTHAHYPIDYGFEIVRYAETPAGIEQFKKNLAADGVVFTDQDNDVWNEYLADSKECYEEDGEEWDTNPYE